MGVLLQCLIFSLLLKNHLFIKVSTTPKMDYDEAPANAFSRFINVSTPVLTNITSCLWMSVAFEDLGAVWRNGNETEYFEIDMYFEVNYLSIGGNPVIFDIPEHFSFLTNGFSSVLPTIMRIKT